MSKKINIAINGFGRIGRLLFKMALKNEEVEVVAINDLGDVENMTYLLNYDTAQKSLLEISDLKASFKVEENKNFLIIGDKKIPFYSVKNPAELPWKDLSVDVVAECTGVFNSFEKSKAHLDAGAKRVVLSGPTKDAQNLEFAKGKIGSTVLMGINEEKTKTCSITSNGSCTTNASAIPLKIINDKIGIESALLNTIHSYTATQSIVDGPVRKKKDFRRGRAAAQNIIPTTTGSAIAVGKVIEEFQGKFDGIAIRVPTIAGSLVDLTFITKRDTSEEEIKNIFIEASQKNEYKNLLRVEDEPIVSSDIVGDTYPSIIDLNFIKVQGRLVKILAWYDNESGFTHSLLEHIIKIGR